GRRRRPDSGPAAWPGPSRTQRDIAVPPSAHAPTTYLGSPAHGPAAKRFRGRSAPPSDEPPTGPPVATVPPPPQQHVRPAVRFLRAARSTPRTGAPRGSRNPPRP